MYVYNENSYHQIYATLSLSTHFILHRSYIRYSYKPVILHWIAGRRIMAKDSLVQLDQSVNYVPTADQFFTAGEI